MQFLCAAAAAIRGYLAILAIGPAIGKMPPIQWDRLSRGAAKPTLLAPQLGGFERKWRWSGGPRIESRTILGLLFAPPAFARPPRTPCAKQRLERPRQAWLRAMRALYVVPRRARAHGQPCQCCRLGGNRMRLDFAPASADTLAAAPRPARGDASVRGARPARFSCQTPKCRSPHAPVGPTDHAIGHS